MWVEACLRLTLTPRWCIIPLLVLDSYRCHMMASVVHRIQEVGVEVIHIPGRCTSLCQPVDVGFNKPFKDRIKRLWTTWIDEVLTEMRDTTKIIKNAWLKSGYEWFEWVLCYNNFYYFMSIISNIISNTPPIHSNEIHSAVRFFPTSCSLLLSSSPSSFSSFTFGFGKVVIIIA